MGSGRRVAEIGLSNPGGGVKEERKPADPGPELHPADSLNSRREMPGCFQDLCEHLNRAYLRVGVPAQTRWSVIWHCLSFIQSDVRTFQQ